jgi:hypothetical protein
MNIQRRDSPQSHQVDLVVQISLLSGLLVTVLGFLTAALAQ